MKYLVLKDTDAARANVPISGTKAWGEVHALVQTPTDEYDAACEYLGFFVDAATANKVKTLLESANV